MSRLQLKENKKVNIPEMMIFFEVSWHTVYRCIKTIQAYFVERGWYHLEIISDWEYYYLKSNC